LAIEGWAAHGSQKYCLRGEAGLNSCVGQGVAELCESRAADLFFVQFEIVAEAVGHLF
jgi:hypothetical protein